MDSKNGGQSMDSSNTIVKVKNEQFTCDGCIYSRPWSDGSVVVCKQKNTGSSTETLNIHVPDDWCGEGRWMIDTGQVVDIFDYEECLLVSADPEYFNEEEDDYDGHECSCGNCGGHDLQ
jgi:hypothetical protein